jgi:preprotein translocase subunit SecG
MHAAIRAGGGEGVSSQATTSQYTQYNKLTTASFFFFLFFFIHSFILSFFRLGRRSPGRENDATTAVQGGLVQSLKGK